MKSPTQRSLAYCRERGWTVQVVEHWNPFARRRVDLFGCIDLVAITPEGVLGIQTTSGSGHSSRRKKVLAEKRIAQWVAAGAQFHIWSWSKRGPGKRKEWTLRCEPILLSHFAGVA